MDMIFDICCLMVFMGGFALLFGIAELVFDLACKHIPAFNAWVNDFIGLDNDDDDWESEV